MRATFRAKIAKDGKVKFWSVYEQCWKCVYADLILDRDLATMPQRDRTRIAAASVAVLNAIGGAR